MSLNRFNPRTDPNQKEIVKGLLLAGYSVAIIKQPLDLLIGWGGMGGINGGGKCCLLEIKLPGKERDFTPKQQEFIPGWTGPIGVATTLDEAVAFLESL